MDNRSTVGTVLYFPPSSNDERGGGRVAEEKMMEDTFLITSPGNDGTDL